MMKKFVLWLIRIFKLDIPKEKNIITTKIIRCYVLKSTKYDHSLTVEGDLTVEGNLKVNGEITCYNKEILK